MNKTKTNIDPNRIPEYIAIIMDGNGRWAKSKGLPRVSGHTAGVKAVRRITEWCADLGVRHLTLYTFSEENWNRPPTEVTALMKLLVSSLRKEVKELNKNNVRFTTIGEISKMDSQVQKGINDAITKTTDNTGLNLNLALSYGGRQELVQAIQSIGKDIDSNQISTENIDEKLISKYLYTSEIPGPDLLIRTGGEFRISNFLLWQIAYSEIHFTPTFWPAFQKVDLMYAIADYQSRERRFGKISEQINHEN